MGSFWEREGGRGGRTPSATQKKHPFAVSLLLACACLYTGCAYRVRHEYGHFPIATFARHSLFRQIIWGCLVTNHSSLLVKVKKIGLCCPWEGDTQTCWTPLRFWGVKKCPETCPSSPRTTSCACAEVKHRREGDWMSHFWSLPGAVAHQGGVHGLQCLNWHFSLYSLYWCDGVRRTEAALWFESEQRASLFGTWVQATQSPTDRYYACVLLKDSGIESKKAVKATTSRMESHSWWFHLLFFYHPLSINEK